MGEQSSEPILECALELAESISWQELTLFQVAERLDLSLDEVHLQYAQKDDLVEAWFDQADSAVLRVKPSSEFRKQGVVSRLEEVMMRWFDHLSSHHRVTRQMLAYKFEPGHVHLQILGILRISRTVQWFREAARLESSGIQRVLSESVLSGIFLATFGYWLWDGSPKQDHTRLFLRKRLGHAERIARCARFRS